MNTKDIKNKSERKGFKKIITYINVFIISFVLFIILNSILILFHNHTNIAKKYINPFFVNVEKDFNNLNEYIPNNYNGDIVIILDDYQKQNLYSYNSDSSSTFGIGTTHGDFVYENFKNNSLNNENLKIIRLDKKVKNSFYLNYFQVVSFIDNKGKITNKHYYYNDLIKYISETNKKAHILINQSFFDLSYDFNNSIILNKIKNLKISKATAYKGNDNFKILTEIYGYLFNYNNKNLLYITKCGDYQPTFTSNIECSNEDTSISAPLIGYEYLKK